MTYVDLLIKQLLRTSAFLTIFLQANITILILTYLCMVPFMHSIFVSYQHLLPQAVETGKKTY